MDGKPLDTGRGCACYPQLQEQEKCSHGPLDGRFPVLTANGEKPSGLWMHPCLGVKSEALGEAPFAIFTRVRYSGLREKEFCS